MPISTKSVSLPLAIAAAVSFGAAPALAADHMAGEHGEQAMMEKKDIVETAMAADNFTTLVAAVKQADLVEILKGEGPYTVFAPTDEAFAAVPEDTLGMLMQDDHKAKLTEILTCHVVQANALSDAINTMIADDGGAHPVPTVGGCTLTAEMDGDAITLADEAGNTATVVMADVEASNGVIHAIDTVLMPAPKEEASDM